MSQGPCGPRYLRAKVPGLPSLPPHRVRGQASNGEAHPDRGRVWSHRWRGALAGQPEGGFQALLRSNRGGGPLAAVGGPLLQPVRPASAQEDCSAPPVVTGFPSPQPHQILVRSETSRDQTVVICALGWPQQRQPPKPHPTLESLSQCLGV